MHIQQQADAEGFAILAYCFMPDHVHVLVEGLREDSDCKRFSSRAKQFSGFYYAQRYGRTLWQRYGYERVLRNEEATIDRRQICPRESLARGTRRRSPRLLVSWIVGRHDRATDRSRKVGA